MTTREQLEELADWVRGQLGWWAGLVAAASGAILGQAELVGEPWRHYLTIASVICVAVAAYSLRPMRSKKARTRTGDTVQIDILNDPRLRRPRGGDTA